MRTITAWSLDLLHRCVGAEAIIYTSTQVYSGKIERLCTGTDDEFTHLNISLSSAVLRKSFGPMRELEEGQDFKLVKCGAPKVINHITKDRILFRFSGGHVSIAFSQQSELDTC